MEMSFFSRAEEAHDKEVAEKETTIQKPWQSEKLKMMRERSTMKQKEMLGSKL